MAWKRFQPLSGLVVAGDKSRWPTFFLLLKPFSIAFHWNEMAVIEVAGAADGYYVGFTDQAGRTFVLTKKVHTPRFAGLLGHEDCEFFAVDSLENPQPLTLKLVSRVPKSIRLDPTKVTRI